MKHSLAAGILALSLAFIPSAYAKDVASIDLLSGDFIAVAGVDVDQLAQRDLYKKAVANDKVAKNYGKTKDVLNAWTEGKLDAEKDVDFALFGVPANYNKRTPVVGIVEFKKSLSEVTPLIDAQIASDDKYERRAEGKDIFYIYKRDNTWMTILDDKRVAVGTEKDVKAVLASKKAGKAAKSIKSNKELYKQYQAADKKADIWGAYALTSKESKKLEKYVLDGADGKSFKTSDIKSGTAAINLASGVDIKVVAKMKSEASAADGAAVISTTADGFLGDPALEQMGIGFLKNAIKVTSSKSDVIGTVKLTNDQVNTLIVMGSSMAQ